MVLVPLRVPLCFPGSTRLQAFILGQTSPYLRGKRADPRTFTDVTGYCDGLPGGDRTRTRDAPPLEKQGLHAGQYTVPVRTTSHEFSRSSQRFSRSATIAEVRRLGLRHRRRMSLTVMGIPPFSGRSGNSGIHKIDHRSGPCLGVCRGEVERQRCTDLWL